MASKHQLPSDREFFNHLRQCDRIIRALQRAADRESKLLNEIGHWQDIQHASSPDSTEHRQAMQHILHLLDSPRAQDTWRDSLADGWNDMVWTLKQIAFAWLQIVIMVIFHIVWYAFLIFVALPIVWDWFWQLPPGLQ